MTRPIEEMMVAIWRVLMSLSCTMPVTWSCSLFVTKNLTATCLDDDRCTRLLYKVVPSPLALMYCSCMVLTDAMKMTPPGSKVLNQEARENVSFLPVLSSFMFYAEPLKAYLFRVPWF